MTRRRRPLLPEEKERRSVRQTATGRGQANARPVDASPTRTKAQGAPGMVWVVVEPEADIAARVNPYISFDPDGTYP